MKTYTKSEKDIKKEKTIRITALVVLYGLLIFIRFFLSDSMMEELEIDESSLFTFMIVFILFITLVSVLNMSKLGKNYFEIHGYTLTYYKNNNAHKEYDLKFSNIQVSTVNYKRYFITFATRFFLDITDENGKHSRYALETLGKETFYQLVNDVNAIKIQAKSNS